MQFLKWMYHPNDFVMGWISLFTAIVFFGGIQMLTIGILGTYIGNIFDEVKNRPEYIIESRENE
jgi:dolichol-phosphate mannosyltransferase